MSRRSEQGRRTYEEVRRLFDEWIDSRPPAPTRPEPRAIGPTLGDTMSKIVLTVIGVGTGLLLLAMAAYSYYSSALWDGYARNGAATGYFLCGFFLTIAGVGCIWATWNHLYRVLDPNRPAAAHH